MNWNKYRKILQNEDIYLSRITEVKNVCIILDEIFWALDECKREIMFQFSKSRIGSDIKFANYFRLNSMIN